MHSSTKRTFDRIERALRDRVTPFIYTAISELKVDAWKVGGEPVSPKIALGLQEDSEITPDYQPFKIGERWGAAWDTTWFRFEGVAPKEVPVAEKVPGDTRTSRTEVVINFGWADHSVGFQCEGLVYRPDGTIVKALNPKTRWIPLDELAEPGEKFVFYVEAASNPLLLGVPPFQPIEHSAKPDVYEGDLYTLRSAEICTYHAEVAALASDIEVLEGLAKTLPEKSARYERILMAIDDALNTLDNKDAVGTAAAAREKLAKQLNLPANASAHDTSAMGHAHIDSAWLWPLRETERKVARTVANVLELLEEGQDFLFTMSSAQQFKWLEERYPELFERVKTQVENGRIIPVGGMWVEPDGMLPNGESFARQVLLGQKYFQETFGEYCDLVWLPDSFGYSGALPQIAKQGGMNRFLTQKISWNDTNTFPHHSFWWEGIDGTRILTHFPPSDTYNAEVTAEELDRAASNYRDKGISDNSILLFGYGDGGGGPTREMVARAQRFHDLEDASRVDMRTPQEFFDRLHDELKDADSSWVGELYLELHRGTFTSQTRTKVGNRRNESLLRDAEAAATHAALLGWEYPAEAFNEVWEELLLAQFHDILPGTSIKWVHDETEETLAGTEARLREILDDAREYVSENEGDNATFLEAKAVQVEGPTLGESGDEVTLENAFLKVIVDADGLVTSVWDKIEDREIVQRGDRLGKLALYKDEPVMWDAWDIEKSAFDTEQIIDDVQAIDTYLDDGVAQVSVRRKFGDSCATTIYRLCSDSKSLEIQLDIDWQEEEKLLKLLLPLDLHANSARFETQFGFVERAIHENTSWDAARFEVPAHRYLHVIEGAYGVGLANDAAYGYSVGKPRGGGVLIGASVLKSANFPDQKADRGFHTKRWSLVPTGDTTEVLDEAEELNRLTEDEIAPLVNVVSDGNSARVSSMKMAHDGSGDVIIRLFESVGNRTKARVEFSDLVSGSTVTQVDFLEDPVGEDDLTPMEVDEDGVSLSLRPFQVVTLRLTDEE